MFYANQNDQQTEQIYLERENDWRNGAIVYQVLVDRFAPPSDLATKKHFYPAPKQLKSWQQVPEHGCYLEKESLWSHEIEFWGGDLNSVSENLKYICELGVDVLYLNPIHLAYTNHKYDSLDFLAISPEFGNRYDLKQLIEKTHSAGLKIVLDGVFNHMGRNSDFFKQAYTDNNSEYRDWFVFDESISVGYRAWANAANLPELNLENKQVADYIYLSPESVVQSYLADGIDGWRLDVAHDIGFNFLTELTQTAHQINPKSLIVGEIWCYPQQWFPAVDGVMNFSLREIIWHLCQRQISAQVAMQMLTQMLEETHFEHLLKSWIVLDNHDTPRLCNMLPDSRQQDLALVLQYCLPGAPNLYYGTELGMTGGEDPEMRAPMRWDLVTKDNSRLQFIKQLIQLRKKHRALKIGDFKPVFSDRLFAFIRYTNRVADSTIVVINPSETEITEYLMIPDSKLMNMGGMTDLISGEPTDIYIKAAMIKVNIKAGGFLILSPDVSEKDGYTTYKRVN